MEQGPEEKLNNNSQRAGATQSITVKVLLFRNLLASHIKLELTRKDNNWFSDNPVNFIYQINPWYKTPQEDWGIPTSTADSETIQAELIYSFEIQADPRAIVAAWKDRHDHKPVDIFRNNCADAVQWFLEKFADVPALDSASIHNGWAQLCCCCWWKGSVFPVTLPDQVMDHVILCKSKSTMNGEYGPSTQEELQRYVAGLKGTDQHQVAQQRLKHVRVLYSHLDQLDSQGQVLRDRGYIQAAYAARKLIKDLRTRSATYVKGSRWHDYNDFVADGLKLVNQAKPPLARHRGWKHLLGNIALAILGGVVVYAIAAGIKKMYTGRWTFFCDTRSLTKVRAVESGIRGEEKTTPWATELDSISSDLDLSL